jgi:hypothetical protein
MTTEIEPKLAPPGAGLPAVELAIARILIAVGRATGSRDSQTAKFQAEREKIRALLTGLDPAQCGRRVLVRRVIGMEDSSRFWSVWMTLDHLRIIHDGMARIIGSLGKGVVPPGQSSTAAVKPSLDADAGITPRYEASCDTLLAAAAGVPELKTAARYAHPWFGPLDAAGWYGVAGVHLGIHRVQLERIAAGLPDHPHE